MFKKLLWSLLLGAFFLALVLTWQNDFLERQNRQVEIAVDHQEINEIIKAAGLQRRDFLLRLRALGVTSIAVREDDLEQLQAAGRLLLLTGSELFWLAGLSPPGEETALSCPPLRTEEIVPARSYLLVGEKELAEKIQGQVALKLNRSASLLSLGGAFVVELDFLLAEPSLRVTLPWEEIGEYRELGFQLVLRPDNDALPTPEAVRDVLDRFFALENASTVIFDGPAVTGYPHCLEETVSFVVKSGYPLGVIRYIHSQQGLSSLLKQSGYPAVLVHSNYPKIPAAMIASSVREERIRLLYIRFDLDSPDLLGEVEGKLAPLTAALGKQGFTLGPASPIAMTQTSPLQLFLLLVGGVVAPGLLLLTFLYPWQPKTLLLLFALGLLGALAVFRLPNLERIAQLGSLAAVTIFPALAVISQQLRLTSLLLPEREPGAGGRALLKKFFPVLTVFLKTLALSIMGGILASALTARPCFLAGTAEYTGVKLSYLWPLLLVGCQAALLLYRREGSWRLRPLLSLARDFGTTPLGMKHLLLLAAAGAMLFFYITRSGHLGGIEPSALEVGVRYFFREMLLVRPRFKEFLIGHPLALLGLSLLGWRRGSRYRLLTTFALTAGAMGQVSVVNTFSHWTSPLRISLLRTFHGLWLGLLAGAFLIIIGIAFLSWLERMENTT